MKLDIFKQQNKFLMLALDHRSSFKKMFADYPEAEKKEAMIETKKKIIAGVKNDASGLLLDPVYGYEAYKRLKINLPHLICLEKSGYEKSVQGAKTIIQYKAEQLKILGASGVKLLLPFNPESETASYQLGVAEKALRDAKQNDLPFFLEIIIEPEKEKEKLLLSAIKLFLEKKLNPDVFKLEYPGSLDLCRQITKQLDKTPWILLSRGASFDVFKHYLKEAISVGCTGFLVGRALWQEIGILKELEKEKFIQKTIPQRFKELKEIACR